MKVLDINKNSKLSYFSKAVLRQLIPPFLLRKLLKRELAKIEKRKDREEIISRAAYYCKHSDFNSIALSKYAVAIRDFKFPKRLHTYYYDTKEYVRWFNTSFRFSLFSGDIAEVPSSPMLVKARPIDVTDGNANSVILNLNKVRHFIFVKDKLKFKDKKPIAVFRGKIKDKPKRIEFFEKYFGVPGFDLGETNKSRAKEEWGRPVMTISEQLKYRYILSIEGNDVASNLKWIMSSNSIVVQPKPKIETWFQEGLLQGGVHYIEIKDDYSDVQEKLAWYEAHPEECERIIQNAHAFVERFTDPARERLTALLTLHRFFEATGQR